MIEKIISNFHYLMKYNYRIPICLPNNSMNNLENFKSGLFKISLLHFIAL